MANQEINLLTREDMESIRFVQNVSHMRLFIHDLPEGKGCTLEPDEVVDLTRFFTKKDLGKSQGLDHYIKNGKLVIIKHNEKVDAKTGEKTITLEGVSEEKTKARGADLPLDVPVVDREKNIYDTKLKEARKKEKDEIKETEIGDKDEE